MRSFEERKEEIFSRSRARIAQRKKTVRRVLVTCVPLVLCSMIMAPQIIALLAGDDFGGAILPMRIILPAVIMAGIAQVLAIQIIMPLKHDKILLTASAIGAAVSIVINIFS